MNICPVCEEEFPDNEISTMSSHFYSKAKISDSKHIMWLNREISKERVPLDILTKKLEEYYDASSGGLSAWIKKRFVERFFSDNPNIFVLEMQHPTKYTIMGYVTEHYHFLQQWVKSCAFIIARTDFFEVQKFEFDNISEEYFGLNGQPPHFELLLRMGESVGLKRDRVISSHPLPATVKELNFLNKVSSSAHWLDAMVSMHSLELIADRNVKQYGAKYAYFRHEILEGEVSKETARFLMAGYYADQYHSGDALRLIDKYATEYEMGTEVQSYFLRSADYFYDYLNARYERGRMYEKEL